MRNEETKVEQCLHAIQTSADARQSTRELLEANRECFMFDHAFENGLADVMDHVNGRILAVGQDGTGFCVGNYGYHDWIHFTCACILCVNRVAGCCCGRYLCV